MGEIAEMHLDGTLCERCGVYLGHPVGYPRYCSDCFNDMDDEERRERGLPVRKYKPKKGIKMKKKYTDHDTQLRKVISIVTAAIKLCVDMTKEEKDRDTQLAIYKSCILAIAEHVKPILKELAEEEKNAKKTETDNN